MGSQAPRHVVHHRAADNGFGARDREECTLDCVRAYRDAMAQFAGLGLLDVWYAQISADRLLERLGEAGRKKRAKQTAKKVAKAKRKDSRHVLSKLAEKVDGRYRIIDDSPWVVPLRSMADVYDPSRAKALIDDHFQQYIGTLPDNIAVIARRFTPIDMALKVVGVGSVGTRCFIILLEGRDEEDPLFLQVKEAGASRSRVTSLPAHTTIPEGAWSRVSDSCRPTATSSSAG